MGSEGGVLSSLVDLGSILIREERRTECGIWLYSKIERFEPLRKSADKGLLIRVILSDNQLA